MIKSDLISRQDAIEAVRKEYEDAINIGDNGDAITYDIERILSALPSAENSNAKVQNSNQETQKSNGDLIYRADAIEAVAEDLASALNVSKDETRELAEHALSALPSAEAEPTVIRSRTFMPTKDFKEWAKRIKEVNPNAVVIPCDAEVVSADSVQGWIPVRERLPKENGEYIVSLEDSVYPWAKFFNGKWFMLSINAIAREFGEYEVLAWMPLPETYRECGEV